MQISIKRQNLINSFLNKQNSKNHTPKKTNNMAETS